MKRLIFIFILFCVGFGTGTMPVVGESMGGLSVAGGVVPHHLLAKEIIDDFFEFIAGQEQHPETIILLSPDHFNCSATKEENSFISVGWDKSVTELEDLSTDIDLLKRLTIDNNIISDRSAVLAEFGITNLLPFIKKYLPETKIVPILIPESITQEEVIKLVQTIDQVSDEQTIIIASVDFSHYLPAGAAIFHDARSIRVLLNFEESEFENIEVDSWQSLYAMRLFAKLRGSENPAIVVHKNSLDFLPCDFNSTTSYFSVVFRKGIPENNLQVETILLAGDMMLGRGIEELMKENSIYYPFLKIVQLLRDVDVVFANLEGPIVENIEDIEETAMDESKFNFRPEVLEALKWSRINLLSLANNHIMDRDKEGLEETLDWLQRYQIRFIGTPLSAPVFSHSKNIKNYYFATEQSVFLAFNRVLPFIDYQEEINKGIQKARQSNPEKIIIVSMHWGNEYQAHSGIDERELAGKIVDAGADITIGHHPHVVWEIEMIKGKPVFYSLGNFIFDRQFLPQTREGLVIGLIISTDKLTFHLFPIKNQSGQPILMEQNEKELFLKSLAEKSNKSLRESIKKGIIELELVN
ncbi:MAG TPA: AmmeMemoRadiSam system protein B [Atribacterota bacterium]|nr:AmmeMemoRadiSam system protein B [Atribacterota bacterium]